MYTLQAKPWLTRPAELDWAELARHGRPKDSPSAGPVPELPSLQGG
jgi:hypothetical protein